MRPLPAIKFIVIKLRLLLSTVGDFVFKGITKILPVSTIIYKRLEPFLNPIFSQLKKFSNKLKITIRKYKKILLPFSIGISVILIPIVILLAKNLMTVEAAWFNDSWAFRQKVTFTHTADIAAERRVVITIDTTGLVTNGKIQSNCADARFTDLDGKVLLYQLTSACNLASTTFDVVFPKINNGTNIGYFYYGNSTVGAGSTDVSAITSIGSSVNTGSLTPTVSVSGSWTTDNCSSVIDCVSTGSSGWLITNTASQSHIFSTFDFNVPAGATILGMEVFTTAAACTNCIGADAKIDIALSHNGSNYTTPKTVILSTSNQNFTSGSSSDTWGRTWSDTELNNTNFRLRITSTTGGGGTSFPPGSLVLTSDGNYVPIETLQVGDPILSLDTDLNTFIPNTITSLSAHPSTELFTINGDVQATGSELIYTRKTLSSDFIWLRVDELEVGDTVLKEDGDRNISQTIVESIDVKYGEFTVYTIKTDLPYNNYWVNNYLFDPPSDPNLWGLDLLRAKVYYSSSPTATFGSEAVGPGPTGYWKFDESFGTSANDSTLNANHGLLGEEAIPETAKIRQEINIIDGTVTATGDDSAIVQLDTTKYSGTVTYYFEAVAQRASNTLTLTLQRVGTATSDATLTYSSETSYTRQRTSFTPPAGTTEYNINVNGGATSPSIKAARILIFQDTGAGNSLTGTETQIEIGNLEAAKTNTSDAALTSPKYWYYDSANWDGTVSFYAEATYLKAADGSGGSESFTTAGAGSWVAPAGVTSITAKVWGGGGAGGGAEGNPGYGSGGAGGCYVAKAFTVVPGNSYSYTVAAVKTGNSSNSAAQNLGNTSWFSSNDSSGAVATGGGGGGPALSNGGVGTAGASCSLAFSFGDTERTGGTGDTGSALGGFSGGGGGGAGTTANGGNASGSTAGTGTTIGGGNGGAGLTSGRGAGGNGSQAGGGGGGGLANNNANQAGGDGAAGRVDVEWAGISGTTTIKIQEDDGSFANWADKATILSGGTSTTADRVRSSSFTPTTGRNYRLVASTSNSVVSYNIYNAKIVVQQTGTITKLEPQYLLANTAFAAGTSNQDFDTLFDPAEWENVTNTYYHEGNGSSSTTSSIKIIQSPDSSPSDITNSTITPTNRTRSSTLTMPVSSQTLDNIAVTNNNGIYASRIVITAIVDASSGGSVAGTLPTWQSPELCFSGNCMWLDGTDDIVTISNAEEIDFDLRLNDAFTFQTWIKPTGAGEGTGGQIFYKGTNTWIKVSNLSNGLLDLSASLDLATTDATATASASIPINTWSSVVLTYSDDADDEISLWVNGLQVKSSTDGSGAPASDANDLLIGGTTTNNFKGFIDEFKIYSFERSSDQIKANALSAPGTSEGSVASLSANADNNPVLTNGLIGYWRLNETSGNASDSSGFATTLTNNGTTTYVSGKFGNGSEHVPASTQYLSTVATISGVKTVSFWTNPDSTTNYFVSLTSGAYITATSGTLSATGFTNPTIYINGAVSNTIEADAWQLVTVVSDTAIDANQFYIGRQSTNYYDGTMDDVRIYSRTLSPTDILSIYNWAPGPTGWWKMDEANWTRDCSTDSVMDSSGNGYNGDSCPSTTGPTTTTGKYGNAGSFDGSNDRVVITDNSNLDLTGNFTVSAWVLRQGGSGFQLIAKTNATDGGYALLGGNSGEIYCRTSNGSTWVDSFTATGHITVSSGWKHVTAVRSGSSCRIYINGIDETTTLGTHTTVTANDVNLTLGMRPDASIEAFNGKLDEVRVYNYARTPGQITEDMNAGHPLGGSPIGSQVAYYKLDEQQGTTINNTISTNTFTETMTGTTWKTAGSASCKINGCLEFDGSDDEISIANSNAIDLNNGLQSGFTVSAWIYPDSDGEGDVGRIFDKGTGTYLRVGGESGGKMDIVAALDLTTDASALTVSAAITTSAWNHVALVWTNDSDDEFSIYVNGVLRGTSTGGSGNPANESNALIIGGDSSTTGNFDGRIDEFKVYSGELTAAQIQLDMNANSAISFGGVVGTQDNEGIDGAGTAPMIYWKFDENTDNTCSGGTNDVCDFSGNGRDAAITNSTANNWVQGKYGSGLNFDGSDDVIPLASFTTPTIITLEAWIKPESFGGGSLGRLMQHSSFILFVDSTSSKITFQALWTGNGSWSINNAINLNQWTHIAVAYDYGSTSNVPSIYINGVKTALTSSTQPTGSATLISATFRVGNNDTASPTRGFDGYMDEIKVYNYARSAAQIAYDYNRGAPLAHYKFDECQGATAYNSAPAATGLAAGNNGTITPGATGNTTVGSCNSGTTTEMWDDGTTGKFNGSLGFDGVSDFVDMGTNANLDMTSNFSIAGWFKVTSVSGSTSQFIASKDFSTGNRGWGLGVASSKLKFEKGGTNLLNGVTTLSNDTWYHGVTTFDGTTWKLYLNGVLEKSIAGSASLSNTSAKFMVGARHYVSAENYLGGQIDDVRLYNYDLSVDQIKQIYNNGAIFFGPSTGSP